MRIIKALLFVAISTVAVAQPQNAREKIEAAKIALITERLNLTPEQAQKFWPVYNEYSKKQQELRRTFENAKRNHNAQTATDEETKKLLDLGIKTKEQALQLEKQYSDRLLKVIDNRQLLGLRKAENDFKEMILKRLRDQQMRREQMRDRVKNQQDMQRRRNN